MDDTYWHTCAIAYAFRLIKCRCNFKLSTCPRWFCTNGLEERYRRFCFSATCLSRVQALQRLITWSRLGRFTIMEEYKVHSTHIFHANDVDCALSLSCPEDNTNRSIYLK